MWELFATQYVNDWKEVCYEPTTLGYACLIVAGLLCFALAIAAVRSRGGDAKAISTKQIVFSAMAMALATITSMMTLFKMPMGGSVTPCSMLFIVLIGYWYGPRAGILTGLAHGILQLILDPYILSLPQMLVDYPLAFGALGLSGFFHNSRGGLAKGYLLGIFGRFVMAFLSGWLFFYYYAPEGWNVIWYSIAYNGTYIGAEGILTMAILALPPMQKALATVKNMATAQ